MPCGCFLHQTAPRNFLICAQQTAELLACLAQKSPRKTHSRRAHFAGICCVTLGLGLLICAEQTPHPRPSQALHLLRDMHSLREWRIENSCPSCLSCRSDRNDRSNRKKQGSLRADYISGRCDALRRRVADEMVAHSNLFESGLAVRLLHYLRKMATPHRKGYTKNFWATFYKKSQKKKI